jgi:glutamate synthase domain-containing protein 3
MTEKKGRPSDAELPDDEVMRYEDAFHGVQRYLLALGNELRAVLGRLGLSKPEDLVGRVDLLEQVPTGNRRVDRVDLTELLVDPYERREGRRGGRPLSALMVDPTAAANQRLLDEVQAGKSEIALELQNSDRSVGATMAGWLSMKPADAPQFVNVLARGWAGQAFGFACNDGQRLELEGYANDSVAEAMSGGTVVVRQPSEVPAEVRGRSSAIGNAACYGATGGRLFVEGRAGQRFGVRNSGATLVCEGAGKYAFEYMTGGVGVVLGPVGPVLGSGMTGGTVWVHEADRKRIEERLHKESVQAQTGTAEELDELRALVEAHATETQSPLAKALLADWAAASARFLKIVPVPAAAPAVAAPAEAVVQLRT